MKKADETVNEPICICGHGMSRHLAKPTGDKRFQMRVSPCQDCPCQDYKKK